MFFSAFTLVFLALTCASNVRASTIPYTARWLSYGVKLKPFNPPTSYETFGAGIAHPLSISCTQSIEDAALSFLYSTSNFGPDSVKYRTGYAGETAKHAYLSQAHNGIPFANAVANIHFNHDGKIVAFGSSFVKPTKISDPHPTLCPEVAIAVAESVAGGRHLSHIPISLEYYAKNEDTTVLTYAMQIRNKAAGTWYEVFVDAHSGEPVSLVDFVARSSYHALPITKQDITQHFETLIDPQDLFSSPKGWHSDLTGGNHTSGTSGNNIISYKDSTISTSQESSAGPEFIYVQDPTQDPSVDVNLDAARVNAFYIGNTIHDFAYRYGFTEPAYNFQDDNFNRGGAGKDRVLISVQDSSGANNAYFATPPDGQSGEMSMFAWDYTSPRRDGALENDIVVHEYTHGITNRMTGGGTGRCLQTRESAGMGEGWGDALAEWTEQTSGVVKDYVLGQYVIDNQKGIRRYPYSTSNITNPLRYSSLMVMLEVHDVGEVWANLLHNLYAALVERHGFAYDAKTNPDSSAGNVVFLHLFMDALALQPCNPTFPTARDAWLQADALRYEGANKCLLWNVFASRGLGVGAAYHNNSPLVPDECLRVVLGAGQRQRPGGYGNGLFVNEYEY